MIKILQVQTIHFAVKLLNQIPEFTGEFTVSYLQKRLKTDAIVLVAFSEDKPVGCKIAYERFSDGSLYSWLGGVLPTYRKQGIAQMLNRKMETLAKGKGYTSMTFKTRNKHKAMLQFGLKNGYQIIGFEEKEDISENRIILKKLL